MARIDQRRSIQSNLIVPQSYCREPPSKKEITRLLVVSILTDVSTVFAPCSIIAVVVSDKSRGGIRQQRDQPSHYEKDLRFSGSRNFRDCIPRTKSPDLTQKLIISCPNKEVDTLVGESNSSSITIFSGVCSLTAQVKSRPLAKHSSQQSSSALFCLLWQAPIIFEPSPPEMRLIWNALEQST